jgi:hypothetical protein
MDICTYLELADSHWELLESFHWTVTYDWLAYPASLAYSLSSWLQLAGC